MSLDICLVLTPHDHLHLLLLALAHNTAVSRLLLLDEHDLFKNSVTLRRVHKFHPQKYQVLLSKTTLVTKGHTLESLLRPDTVLLKNDYQENEYLIRRPQQGEHWLHRLHGRFGKVVSLQNLYDQPAAPEERRRVGSQILILTGLLGPSQSFPQPGWVDQNSYFSQLVLAIGENVLNRVPVPEQKMFQVLPADLFAQEVSNQLVHVLESSHDLYLLSDSHSVDLLTFFSATRQAFYRCRGIELDPLLQVHPAKASLLNAFNRLQIMSNSIVASFSHHQKMKLAQEQFRLQKGLTIKRDLVALGQHELAIKQLATQPIGENYNVYLISISLQSYLTAATRGIYQHILNLVPKESRPINKDKSTPKDGYFSDLRWVMERGQYAKVSGQKVHIQQVLSSRRIQDMLTQLTAKQGKQPYSQSPSRDSTLAISPALEKEAVSIMKIMFADMHFGKLKAFALIMHKIFQNLYTTIKIDPQQMASFRNLAKNNADTPVVIIPTHRSYVDFLLMSYVLFAQGLKVPHIVSGDDFLKMKGVAGLLRSSGAFFIKRKELQSDPLYKEILKEYMQNLLRHNQWVEFFIEGTRSRTGKMLPPKFGILNWVVETVLEGQLDDLIIQPVTINYERVLEAETFPMELLGEQKVKESLSRLLKSAKTLLMNFGQIHLEFAQPIHLKSTLAAFRQHHPPSPTRDKDFVQEVGVTVVRRLFANLVILPTNLLSTVVLDQTIGLSVPELHERILVLKKFLLKRQCRIFYEGVQDLQQALKHLEFLVQKKKDSFTMWISPKRDYTNNILLSLYRAPVQQILLDEALVIISLHKMHKHEQEIIGCTIERLFHKVQFLFEIFKREVRHSEKFQCQEKFKGLVEELAGNGIMKVNGNRVEVNFKEQETEVQQLQGIAISLVEGVWAFLAGVQMVKLPLAQDQLLKQIQFMTEQFLSQRDIESIESCSLETLKIGESFLRAKGILVTKNKETLVTDSPALRTLENKMAGYKTLLLGGRGRKLKGLL